MNKKLNINKQSVLSEFNELNVYTIIETLNKFYNILEEGSIKDIQPIYNEDYSTCLKGFLITCYLRLFNEGTDIISHEPILYIFQNNFYLIKLNC